MNFGFAIIYLPSLLYMLGITQYLAIHTKGLHYTWQCSRQEAAALYLAMHKKRFTIPGNAHKGIALYLAMHNKRLHFTWQCRGRVFHQSTVHLVVHQNPTPSKHTIVCVVCIVLYCMYCIICIVCIV